MTSFFRAVLVSVLIFSSACSLIVKSNPENIDYKQEMRSFVHEISAYAKDRDANFIIIPQNGIELVTKDSDEIGTPDERKSKGEKKNRRN